MPLRLFIPAKIKNREDKYSAMKSEMHENKKAPKIFGRFVY